VRKSSHQLRQGYLLEIDGKFESEYGTLFGALKAGFELRQKFPQSQVKVHDVNEQTSVYELCVPKTPSVLISGRNRLTSAHYDRADMFRPGFFGGAIQVEDSA
jgi:hypothetical protein